MSIIWLSSSWLSLSIIKTLVPTKLRSFIQTIIYSKLATFLPVTFFKWKSYLKILYICGNLGALKELFISYEFSGLCFAESFCEVAHGKSPRILSVSYCAKIFCLALDTLPWFFPECDIIISTQYKVPIVFCV